MLCHSYYSFLEGAASPEELVARAKSLGFSSLAITDRNGLYGASSFYQACVNAGIHPVIGAHLGDVTLLCENGQGYQSLGALITEAQRRAPKGEVAITWDLFEKYSGGLFCLIERVEDIERAQAIYGHDRVYGMLNFHLEEGDERRCHKLMQIPCVAGRVYYAEKEQAKLFDVLTCIRHGVTIENSAALRAGNAERYLRPLEELYGQFRGVIEQSEELLQRCNVQLDFRRFRTPKFHGANLRKLCEAQAKPHHKEALETELTLIEKLDMTDYFLIVWDIVAFAKKRGIPCQGRGSAANSLVAYLLGITPIDPLEHELFLGRFIHEGMTNVPDIDLDFAASRDSGMPDREDVIRYIYEKYDHVAMVATFITFKKKMARREVLKVMGEEREDLIEGLIGIPRHLSIHVGGMLIAARPIHELVPLEPARMEGRVVCQWDKDMVDDAGLIKLDILSLGMLAVLRDVGVDYNNLTFDDPSVYEMISNADTIGIFQVESRAQMQSLPRTRPQNLKELAVQVAIIRPGPLQGNMVQPYIKRKQGLEPVSYPHPSLEPVLKETLGVILFQEQVLKVAVAMSGFSEQQAANLRRSMSRKRSKEAMEALRADFVAGAEDKVAADHTFDLLLGFASYGFCKSHALSFAIIAYQSAYLKRYYPAHFTAAILNNQPMGFYPNETLLEDAKRHGVEILPPDINKSRFRSTATGKQLRLGLNLIKGIAEPLVEEHQPYQSLFQLMNHLPRDTIEALIEAGALESLGISRRGHLWQLFAGDQPLASTPQLPSQSQWEKMLSEFRMMSLSTTGHPLAFLRADLTHQGYDSSKTLRDGLCRVVGLQVCRQRPPTAKGFIFITLEDEFGLINVIIPPNVPADTDGPFLSVTGTYEGINLRAKRVQPCEISPP